MKNTGKEFEALSHKVFTLLSSEDKYASVELDVLLDSPDGQRQFDVVIHSKLSGLNILTVIECRDYSKNLTVSNVDGFYSKMQDVNANKGVLVARKGFSKTAKQKANRLGITICTAHDFNRELENIGLQIPLTFISIDGIDINVSYNAYMLGGTTIKKNIEIHIGEITLFEYFKNEFKSREINTSILNEVLSWKPETNIVENAYMYDINKNKIKIQDIEVMYKLNGTYYFGYVHDLPNSIGINNLSQDEINIFIDSKDILFDYKKNLTSYSQHKDIPCVSGSNIVISNDIDFNYSIGDVKLELIQKIDTLNKN